MRKLIKVATVSALAVIAVATSALPAFAASTTLEGRHKIGDLYFGVSKSGLSIANKNADHLLYGKKNGGTSKAFMSVDDNDAAQPLFAVPDISPSKSTVTYTMTHKNVEGTLVWKVIPNSVTHAKDVVEITLTMKNIDTKSHKVGGRINVDTMLGDNDGAPFRIGSKAVTAPVAYEGNKIPAVFQTVDSLSDPQIVTNGRFGVGAYAPDKVQFNDCIVSEKQKDFEGALGKVQSLVEKYPNDETYKREYDFLNSRININPEPVHTEGDADVTY